MNPDSIERGIEGLSTTLQSIKRQLSWLGPKWNEKHDGNLLMTLWEEQVLDGVRDDVDDFRQVFSDLMNALDSNRGDLNVPHAVREHWRAHAIALNDELNRLDLPNGA